MKRLVFAASVLALGFSASSAARADYAVVMFKDGYCRVWAHSAATPVSSAVSSVWTARVGSLRGR